MGAGETEAGKAGEQRDTGGALEVASHPDEAFALAVAQNPWHALTLVGRNLWAHGPFWLTLALLPSTLWFAAQVLGSVLGPGFGWLNLLAPLAIFAALPVAAAGARASLAGDRCVSVRDVVARAPGRLAGTFAAGTTYLLASGAILAGLARWFPAAPALAPLGAVVLTWYGLHFLAVRTAGDAGVIPSFVEAFDRATHRLLPPYTRWRIAVSIAFSTTFWVAVWSAFAILRTWLLAPLPGEGATLGILVGWLFLSALQTFVFLGVVLQATHLHLAWSLEEGRSVEEDTPPRLPPPVPLPGAPPRR